MEHWQGALRESPSPIWLGPSANELLEKKIQSFFGRRLFLHLNLLTSSGSHHLFVPLSCGGAEEWFHQKLLQPLASPMSSISRTTIFRVVG
jgi:hypothetical protein